jgi:hypothetical protein
VKKKLCPANPCAGVEFPVILKGLFRPHYMTWSEQQVIELHAPIYLRKRDPNSHGDRIADLQRARSPA